LTGFHQLHINKNTSKGLLAGCRARITTARRPGPRKWGAHVLRSPRIGRSVCEKDNREETPEGEDRSLVKDVQLIFGRRQNGEMTSDQIHQNLYQDPKKVQKRARTPTRGLSHLLPSGEDSRSVEYSMSNVVRQITGESRDC